MAETIRDADPDDGRDETENERLDRNWNELLQELRVTQTGSQILTGFLLTIPFQPTFADLPGPERGVYLGLVVLAVVSTVIALAPVSLHRVLFRRNAKTQIVAVANVLLRLSFVTLALTLTGTTLLIFDLVAGPVVGFVTAGATLVIAALVWFALPELARRRLNRD
jgi:O-antigen/teichoic acid export membrane protein